MRFSVCLLVVLCLACLFSYAKGAVLGIDFGSKYIKVASVRPNTPFHIVVDEATRRKIENAIAIIGSQREFGNHAKSRFVRKSKDSFLWASHLLGRGPDSAEFARIVDEAYGFELSSKEYENGDIGIEFTGSTESYTPDAFVAMMFEYIMKLAADDAGSHTKDCVITVPIYATQSMRQAILDAADIAGLNVLSLIDENTAVGVQYGIDRKYDGSEADDTIIALYNMGARTTQVSVIKYSSYGKGKGKSAKTIGQLEVIGTGFDTELGGEAFRNVILRLMREHAEKDHPGEDLKGNSRTMAKMRDAAEKAKLVLSANTEYVGYIESLHNDKDFKFNLHRDDFYADEESAGLLGRVAAPLTDALASAELTLADLDSIVLFGGGVRVPGVQDELRNAVGELEISTGINGDESAAMGAVLRAANMSTTFKVRKFGLTDITQYAVNVHLYDESAINEDGSITEPAPKKEVVEGEEEEEPEDPNTPNVFSKRTSLFTKKNKLGKKKTVAFKHDNDFLVNLHYGEDETLPSDMGSTIAFYNITGLNKWLENEEIAALVAQDGQQPRVAVTFGLDQSGMVQLVKAEATLEEMVEVLVPKKKVKEPVKSEDTLEDDGAAAADSSDPVPEPADPAEEDAGGDDDAAATDATDADAADTGAGESDNEGSADGEADPAPAGDGSDAEPSAEEAANDGEEKTEEEEEEEKKPEVEMETVLKKHTHRQALRARPVTAGLKPSRLSDERKVAIKEQLRALRKADERRKQIAFAKNELESHLFSTRSRLYDEEVEEVSTDEQIETLSGEVQAAMSWMYTVNEEDEDVVAQYNKKLREVSLLSEPIFTRVKEMEARPEAVEAAVELLNYTFALIEQWKEEKPWLPEDDVGNLYNRTVALSEWLETKVETQAALELSDTPAFLSTDVHSRLKGIAKLSQQLLNRKKPYEKPKDEDEEGGKKKKKKKRKRGGKKADDLGGEDEDPVVLDGNEAAAAEEGATEEGDELPPAAATEEEPVVTDDNASSSEEKDSTVHDEL